MIRHIEIEGFKSLKKVSLDLGALNIFVGTNASGKSNFLEALRVLQEIGYGYTVDEILNGKPRGANNEVWEGIRGGSKFARFIGSTHDVRFRAGATIPSGWCFEYAIGISPDDCTISHESLSGNDRELCALTPGLPAAARIRSCLTLGQREPGPVAPIGAFRRNLVDLQALTPSPAILRDYSRSSGANGMGDHGENFAAIVKAILSNDAKHAAYLSWLQELTPAELDDVIVLPGAKSDWLFGIRKDGREYPASVLSDGTLRFAAIAAAFFQPDPPKTLVLEEIEEGLHPTRLQLLIELLKSQTGHGVTQVMATSHSPYTLGWLNEEDYRYVFLCTRDEKSGATSITPLSEIPRLMELVRTQPITDLFAEGWLERAV